MWEPDRRGTCCDRAPGHLSPLHVRRLLGLAALCWRRRRRRPCWELGGGDGRHGRVGDWESGFLSLVRRYLELLRWRSCWGCLGDLYLHFVVEARAVGVSSWSVPEACLSSDAFGLGQPQMPCCRLEVEGWERGEGDSRCRVEYVFQYPLVGLPRTQRQGPFQRCCTPLS